MMPKYSPTPSKKLFIRAFFWVTFRYILMFETIKKYTVQAPNTGKRTESVMNHGNMTIKNIKNALTDTAFCET